MPLPTPPSHTHTHTHTVTSREMKSLEMQWQKTPQALRRVSEPTAIESLNFVGSESSALGV